MYKAISLSITYFVLISTTFSNRGTKDNKQSANPFGVAIPCSSQLVYYGSANNTLQAFDIYVLQVGSSSSLKPIVIFIHGGGFTSVDKLDNFDPNINNANVAALLNSAIAFASINYRLLTLNDLVGIKKCIVDCVLGIQHIQANSNIFRIDPSRIALLGNSAGAGLAMLMAYKKLIAVKALWVGLPQATYDIEKSLQNNQSIGCNASSERISHHKKHSIKLENTAKLNGIEWHLSIKNSLTHMASSFPYTDAITFL